MVLLVAPVVLGDGEDDDEVRSVEAERMVAVSCSGSCWCDGGVSLETCGTTARRTGGSVVDLPVVLEPPWLRGGDYGVRLDTGKAMAKWLPPSRCGAAGTSGRSCRGCRRAPAVEGDGERL